MGSFIDRLDLDRLAGSIEYSLRAGFPTFTFDDEKATGKEEYVMSKNNMNAFMQLSMPPPIIFGDDIIVPPRRPMPGTLSLVTKRVEFRPLKEDLPQDPFNVFPSPAYSNLYMVASIDYETNPVNEDDDDPNDPTTFLEVGFDTTAELLKIPATRTHFGAEGEPQGEGQTGDQINSDNDIPATIVIPTTTYNLNWKLALNPNFPLFRSLIGRVNSVADPLFYNAPKETILFAGYSGKRSFLWDGNQSTTVTPWDLNFKFVGKHVQASNVVGGSVAGWNHIYRPSTGKWEKPKRADGSLLYETTSTWTQMFQSGGLL